MNLPEIKPYEDKAIDIVVSVINRAKEELGNRPTLRELAHTREIFTSKYKVQLSSLRTPLPITSEKFIYETIEKTWRLSETFMYIVKYMGQSQDECSQYYYFEAIFSQPTAEYPIPQATVSVYFRVQIKHTEPAEIRGVPTMTFRIEGHRVDHDARFVALTADSILAVIKMKTKLFERIEKIRLF